MTTADLDLAEVLANLHAHRDARRFGFANRWLKKLLIMGSAIPAPRARQHRDPAALTKAVHDAIRAKHREVMRHKPVRCIQDQYDVLVQHGLGDNEITGFFGNISKAYLAVMKSRRRRGRQ